MKGGVVISIGILLILMFVGFVGFDQVDASHKGVMVKLGQIVGTMDPGIKWTGLFVDVHQYNLRTRKMEVRMEGSEGAVDKDGQSVFARIEINYRMNPASVEDAYAGVGRDSELENILNIDGIIREGFKSVTSNYTSLKIFQKRPEVKAQAIQKIQQNFPKKYFTIENVIISNLDFNPEFKKAIEDKKVQEEKAKAKEAEVKVKQAEANMKIAEAEGEKQKVQLEADAKAYQILKEAESEAESLRLKRQQISAELIQLEWVNAWKSGGAQVPKYIMGDGAQMFLMMPTEDEQQSQLVEE